MLAQKAQAPMLNIGYAEQFAMMIYAMTDHVCEIFLLHAHWGTDLNMSPI